MPLENIKSVENIDQNKDKKVDSKEIQNLENVLNKLKTSQDKSDFTEALKKNDQDILNLLSQQKDLVNILKDKGIILKQNDGSSQKVLGSGKEATRYENSQSGYKTTSTPVEYKNTVGNMSAKIEMKTTQEKFSENTFDGNILEQGYMEKVVSSIQNSNFSDEIKKSAINSVKSIVEMKKNAINVFDTEIPKGNLGNLKSEIENVQKYLKNPTDSKYDTSELLKWRKDNPNHKEGMNAITIALDKIKTIEGMKKISLQDCLKYKDLMAFFPKFTVELMSGEPKSLEVRFQTSTDTMTEYSSQRFEKWFKENGKFISEVIGEGKTITLTGYSSDLGNLKTDDAITSKRLSELDTNYKSERNINSTSGLAIIRAEAIKNKLIEKLGKDVGDKIIVDYQNSGINKDSKYKKGDLLAQRVEMKIN